MESTPELWKATYEAETPEELNKAYKDWACEYDHDTCDVMGYVGPKVAAQILDNHLATKDAKVLDAGCGTGLVGEVLKTMGYRNIEAMDYSPDMLTEAEKKAVYTNVFQADMNERLQVPSDAYDATICVGTFTYAHVGPTAFEELVRVTRPGGYICFTIRDGAYEEYGYRDKMLQLEADNRWKLQEMRQDDYLKNEDVLARFCLYEVTNN